MTIIPRPILIVGLAVSIAFLGGCGDGNIRKAKRYAKEENYSQAIHHYKLALEKDPENRSVRYGLIETYAKQLTDNPAEQVTTELVENVMLELRPIAEPLMTDANVRRYMSVIYQIMARVYADQGLDDKAAKTWMEITRIDPSFAEGHFNLGVALVKQGKHEEAILSFEKTLDLNPYFVRGYFAAGNALVRLGRDEEAIKHYLKGLEINPDDMEVRHNLGVAYSRSGDNEKGIEQLEKAIELEPGYFLAYRSLSAIYSGQKNTEKVEDIDNRWKEFAEAHRQVAGEEEKPSASTGEAEKQAVSAEGS